MKRDLRWTDLPCYALLFLSLYVMGVAARRWYLVLALAAICLLHPLVGHRLDDLVNFRTHREQFR